MKTDPNTADDRNEPHDTYILRLFVTGASPNSARAIANIKRICDSYMNNAYKLEVVDVHQQGELAIEEDIIALPLLIKKFPLPERRLIGDLSDEQKVLKGLGIVR